MSDHNHEHGEDCGCGHDHEHEEFVLTLTDENGKDVGGSNGEAKKRIEEKCRIVLYTNTKDLLRDGV